MMTLCLLRLTPHSNRVPKDTEQKPHVRRHGNLPYPLWTQERELYQARLLPALFLLLPLSVSLTLKFYCVAILPEPIRQE